MSPPARRHVPAPVLVALLLIFAGCGDSIDERESSVELAFLHVIGSDTSSNLFFGNVAGMAARDSSLYVLDRIIRNVRTFDLDDGSYREEVFGYSAAQPAGQMSQGPGEYAEVYSMSLNPSGSRVLFTWPFGFSVLDRDFNEISRTAVMSGTPMGVWAGDDDILIVNGQLGMGRDCCILDHFRFDGDNALAVRSFAERQPEFTSLQKRRLSGFSNTFTARDDGLVFLAFSYPYEIRAYDLESGELVASTRLDTERYMYTYQEAVDDRTVERASVIIGGIHAIDGKLYVFESQRLPGEEPTADYIRIYDAELAPIGLIDLSQFPHGDRLVRMNNFMVEGDRIFLEANVPFPGIAVYEMLE